MRIRFPGAWRPAVGVMLTCALAACSKGGAEKEEEAAAPAPPPVVSLSAETEAFKDPKGVYSISLPRGFQAKERDEEGKSRTMFTFGPGLTMMVVTVPVVKKWKPYDAMQARVEEAKAGKGGVPPGMEVSSSGLVQFGGGDGFEVALRGKVSGGDVSMHLYTIAGAGKSVSVTINSRGTASPAFETIKSAVTGTLVLAGAAVRAPARPAGAKPAPTGAVAAATAAVPEPAAAPTAAATSIVPPIAAVEVEQAKPPEVEARAVDTLPAPAVFQEVESASPPPAPPAAASGERPADRPVGKPGSAVVAAPLPPPPPARKVYSPDWEVAESQLKITGTMQVGKQYAAFVNGNIVRQGETVASEYRGKVYHFKVVAIDGNRVEFEPIE